MTWACPVAPLVPRCLGHWSSLSRASQAGFRFVAFALVGFSPQNGLSSDRSPAGCFPIFKCQFRFELAQEACLGSSPPIILCPLPSAAVVVSPSSP